MATPNLLCYLEESFVYFVNNSTPLDFGLGAYPPNNVQVSLENETEIVFRKSQQAGGLDIITARQFDEILDKTGTAYGVTADDAFNAIIAAIKVSSGGGGGGDATALNQTTQINLATVANNTANDIKANTTGLAKETTLQSVVNNTNLQQFLPLYEDMAQTGSSLSILTDFRYLKIVRPEQSGNEGLDPVIFRDGQGAQTEIFQGGEIEFPTLYTCVYGEVRVEKANSQTIVLITLIK